ncbi:MAG: hypothetical protein Q4B88_00225 [Moraxella sp.]|nr:hypothetical protein [Moraxella sp.]
MKLHFIIKSDSELIGYEAMALAFLFASFEHEVQLELKKPALSLLLDDSTRLHGMVKSTPLYDIPAVWVEDCGILLEKITEHDRADFSSVLTEKPTDSTVLNGFDSVLVF